MNLQTKFAEAETFLAQGYYTQAVNTCGQVVEDLLRHLYQQVINRLPPSEAQRVLEVLQDIGKGKKVDELTLGQLDGLFRQADLSRKLDSVVGQRIQGLDNVRVYIDLRNQATHRGATIERESAEAFLSHTRWLLSQIQAAAQPPRREVSVLSPWPQLARPHEDICKGRFDPDIFAAKLGDVLQEQATFDYQDPEAFFRRTYPTAGLRQLIQTVARRLTNRGGEGVIQLQTPFGGGKTHALLVLYHLFKHRDRVVQLESVQSLLGEITLEELPVVKVAAFVGTDADPEQGRTPWGELAAQLGDYEQLRVHDEKRVAPGKERLRRLLESRAPALLLIDELLEYVVKAAGVHIGEGTLKGQVLAFLQELTETVASLPRVSLILTIPSGLLERYDSAAEEAMAQLKHISGRVEAIYTPVEGMEIYRVIRQRLFENPDDPAVLAACRQVAEAYSALYRDLGEDVPTFAREPSYRDSLMQAYPFHPELIDILFQRWATFSSFQRTRGVLRLLALVVSDLYEREHTAPIIQPAHLNLANRGIREEFISHIGNAFESVVAADIMNHTARARELDREMGPEYRRYQVPTALATAIFFYSFNAGGALQGVSIPRLRLAFSRPGIPPAIVGDALGRLKDELWYLHREEGRYFFSTQPNLNRVVRDYIDDVSDDDISDEVRRQVKRVQGTALAVYPFPPSSREVPDNKSLKLVVLSPEQLHGLPQTEGLLRDIFEHCGEGHRAYKNTLLFLLMDKGGWLELARILRRWIAIRTIWGDPALLGHLSDADRQKVGQEFKETDVAAQILSAYRVLVRGRSQGFRLWDLGMATVGEKSLAERVWSFMETEEIVLRQLTPRYVQERLLGQRDEISYGTVANAFFTAPDNPILESETVLKRAIADGVQHEFFGLKVGEQIYFKEGIADILISDEAYIVNREIAQQWKKAQRVQEENQQRPEYDMKEPELGMGVPLVKPVLPESHQVRIVARVSWDKLSEFVSGVVSPLRNAGAEVTLEVELQAQSKEPISHGIIDLKVRETLQQIGAQVETFVVE